MGKKKVILNPLLHRQFLDHVIIFYFWTTLKKFKKNLSKVLYTFENIMENGAFAPNEQIFHFFQGIKRRYYGVKG